MPERFTRRIIEHLADHRYEPRQVRQLAHDLSIPEAEWAAFERAVTELIDEGQLVLGRSDTLALPPVGREIVGTFRLNERGFGFVVPDSPNEHGDLFVPAGSTGDALTGDHVRAKVIHDPRRGGGAKSPYIGRVIQIIQRADKHYVGNLQRRGSQWFVQVDGRVLHEPVIIRDPHAKGAKIGDKVVIELIDYPADGEPGEGVILEVLGEQGQPDVETRATMRAFGLRERFPQSVMDEARAAARRFDDKAIPPDREDLTHLLISTIDPPDAKDYDDAISIRRLDGSDGDADAGGPASRGDRRTAPAEAVWELGVHIADVSHFVQPDGVLDSEAAERGNSAYLPRRVVPMLPELLSNGVCSLQEGVNRFCQSAFLYYDAKGRVVGERFARTVIRSAKRLTYLEAQALIDGDLREAVKHTKSQPKYPRPLVKALQQMNELAQLIRQRRFDAGMIVLALPEVELLFDDEGNVIDAEPEDDAFTHKIIEMFMVEANEAAARLFNRLDVPMVRRIHPDPDAHDVGDLRRFARVAGFNIPQRPSRRELQQLLDAVRGKPAQQAVHFAVLRTLSKAEYSPVLIGHFALASEHYTHFTSPIRRYPDLAVHRGIEAVLSALRQRGWAMTDLAQSDKARTIGQEVRQVVPDEQAMFELGRHCSGTERAAEAAERDLRTYLVLELLSEHLGDDFAGTVTGVTGSGVFIQLDRFLVDGFVKTNDLPGGRIERWRLNQTTGAMVAQRSGRAISIGDRFTVRIASVDPVRRALELVVMETREPRPSAEYKKLKRKQPHGASLAHQETMQLKRQKDRDKRKPRDKGASKPKAARKKKGKTARRKKRR